MYLVLCDDEGRVIEKFIRRSMFDLRWVMSPPFREGNQYSIVNADLINFFRYGGERGWVSCAGFSREPDSVPFVFVPLERGYEVRYGDGIVLQRGSIVIDVFNIRPGGKQTPDPDPLRSRRTPIFSRT